MIFNFKRKKDTDYQWLSISDLMSGMMILFIFIGINFMRNAFIEKERANAELKKFQDIEAVYKALFDEKEQAIAKKEEMEILLNEKIKLANKLTEEKELSDYELNKVRKIAQTYQNNQQAIFNALNMTFPEEILAEEKLNAEIDKDTLTFIFRSSDSLFDNASSELKNDYKESLKLFFPRYINAIIPYKDSIKEIRIEGHTSSEWGSSYPKEIKSQDDKKQYDYFQNMKLSQARTNAVLSFVLTDLKELIPNEHRQWIRDNMAAVGLSSSKPILNSLGVEDLEKSRRVTFRIITNADSQIQEIIHRSSQNKTLH